MYSNVFHFKFGTDILPDTYYKEETGFGFLHYKNISIEKGPDYLASNNYRSNDDTPNYEYPTFIVNVPNGIYEITFTFGTNGIDDAINGAYVNGNMYAVRWSKDSLATSFMEPLTSSYIVTKAGEKRVENIKAAVFNNKLEICFATSINNDGSSGTVYIKELNIVSLGLSKNKSLSPTLRFIGDSTLAKYPPEDGNVWVPIPERTGWGEDFSMKRFTDESVTLVNKAVAGSSLKSYIYEGFLNDYLLSCNWGDTVIIESGINDTAAGRRFSDKSEFKSKLQFVIDACLSFGQQVILSSGTSSSYLDAIKEIASINKLFYIPLKEEWEQYQECLNLTQAQMTVDGTHLRRVGAIVAAWIVANNISKLNDFSISNHICFTKINYDCPTLLVDNFAIKRQTKQSVTFNWNLPEEQLYDVKQLILGFNIYKQMPDNSYCLVSTCPAYVSAGMDKPFMQATIESDLSDDAYYCIAAYGLTGVGPFSCPVKVSPYELTKEDLKEQLALSELINQENDFILSLNKNFKELINTDFSQEKTAGIPWKLTGNHASLSSIILEETGNKYLKLYVEAAGPRYVCKNFEEAININASEMLLNFDWFPGNPDDRNVTELELYSDETNRIISFKSSCNGHFGFVTGNYDESDVSYMVGNGFHSYENTKAVDLGLSNNKWYNIKLHINYKTQTADLYVFSKESATQVLVVRDIQINTNGSNTIQKLNFLLLRGKQDNRVTNGLSILWETRINKFAMYYCD